MTSAEIAANTEAQAGIVCGLEQLCDIFQTIMTSIAALCSHSQLAKWQGDIIYDYQQVLLLDLQLLKPISDSLTREIHIG